MQKRRCCVGNWLRQWNAAREWIEAALQTGEPSEDRVIVHAMYSLLLAVAEGAELPSLQQAWRRYSEAIVGSQNQFDSSDHRELAVRVGLLDPANGDPSQRFHPARQELSRKRANRQDVDARYEGRLVLLDYRLACLRFVAGVPAVDDFYYSTPQQLPPVVPAEALPEARRCLQKARAAAGWAMQMAQWLDGLLQCDWRQAEVQDRIARIDEIAMLLGESSSVTSATR